MNKNMKALSCLQPDRVMAQVHRRSVRLIQARPLVVEVETAVVRLLEGEAMKPLLRTNLRKQTPVVLYVAVVVKVATPPLHGEAMKLLLSPCCASLR